MFLRVVTGLLFLVVITACYGSDDGISTDKEVVMSVFIHGGLCSYEACLTTAVLSSDGTFIIVGGEGTVSSGTISPELVSGLTDSIKKADFIEIRSNPFVDDCPTAYDGQENIYTFYINDREERVAACETAIDSEVEPFLSVDRALGAMLN